MTGARHIVVRYKKTNESVIEFDLPSLGVRSLRLPIPEIDNTFTLVTYGANDVRQLTFEQFKEVSKRVKNGAFNSLHFIKTESDPRFLIRGNEVCNNVS